MEKYCGNARPYIYTLFGENDKAEAEKIMDALFAKGHSLWYADNFDAKEEKRLNKAAALLVILSPDFAESEALKKAVSQASRLNMPIISVYLSDTKLSPGLSMLLGTTMGVMRQNCADEESFLEKLCSSPVLSKLSVTPAQKAAAKRTSLGLALGAVAIMAAVIIAVVNPFREVVPIDPSSELGRLGLSGNALDITELYIYGNEIREEYSFYELIETYNWNRSIVLDSGELIPNAELSNAADFSQLVNLTELCIAGNLVTDVAPFASLTNLRMLDLSGSQAMQETDLSPLVQLPNLETLNLAFTYISDLSPLENCPALKTLYLSYSGEWLLDHVDLGDVEIIFVDSKAYNYEELKAASEDEDANSIYLRFPIEIPEGETLTVRENCFVNSNNYDNRIVNNGELVIYGKFTMYASDTQNNGTIRIMPGGELQLSRGQFVNTGNIIVEKDAMIMMDSGSVLYQNDGNIINNGHIKIHSDSEFQYNGGMFENEQYIDLGWAKDNNNGKFYGNGNTVTGSGFFMREGRALLSEQYEEELNMTREK